MIRRNRLNWPKAILFDLDGTLLHSAPDIADSLNQLMVLEGMPEFPLESVMKMVGGGVSLLVERALATHGRKVDEEAHTALVKRFLEIYTPRAAEKTRLFPGARNVLESYRNDGIGLGVCTNKPESITRSILEALDVAHLFGAVIGGDTLEVKKPDPAPLLEALERLGCGPADGLMIGDSGADANAARAAGLPVILVTFGYTQTPAQNLPNDGLVESFRELPAAVEQLAASGMQA